MWRGPAVSALIFEDEQMARFKVLTSIHYARPDENKKRKGPHNLSHMVPYKRGEIIESDEDLVTKYPNKFERIVEAGPVVVTQARREAVAKLIETEVWTDDDRTFLEELPDSGFNRILRQAKIEPPKDPDAEEDKPKATAGKSSALGDDVTETFSIAVDNDMKVFKNAAGLFQITKGKSKKPINEEPLEEVQVEAWIQSYLEE